MLVVPRAVYRLALTQYWISSGIPLRDERDQSCPHLEPHIEALAPTPADDLTDHALPHWGTGLAGILEPLWERVAAIIAATDPGIGLRHRRGDHLLGQRHLHRRLELLPMVRHQQALHLSRMMPAGVAPWRPEQ